MIIVGSFLPEPFWLVSATKFTRVCREPTLLWNQYHSLTLVLEDQLAYDSQRMGDPYPQIEVLDFVRLMKDFLEKRINAQQYQRAYFDLNTKRIVLSEEESRILQQAYGDADDFDEAVHLPYTTNEEQLRDRVSASLERLRMLGHVIPDP